METNEKRAVNNRVYFSIIVVLLLLNSFTLYMYFNEKGDKEVVTNERMALQSEFNSLSDSLYVRSNELDYFIGKNSELDKEIAQKQEQMDVQKQEIKRLLSKGKLSQNELAKARDMIAKYEADITNMSAQINQLKQDNEMLAAANLRLNEDLINEKNVTLQLTEQNTGLAQKVQVGSLLHIQDLEVDAVKTRNNGKEVEVHRAKTAANLRISFETGENKVVDPGQLSLYVRIINPKGETIAVQDQGSGVLTDVASNTAIAYTKKADIDYNQTNKKVIVYWGKNIQEPGTYKVELYQAGYMIGTSEVKLS